MTAAVHRPIASAGLVTVLRPLLLLGGLAFLAGFGGYLILGPPRVMDLPIVVPPTATVSTPAEPASETLTPDWNPPRPV